MAAISAQGKIILITGASGGLGRSVSRRFLESGAKVIAVDRSRKIEDGCEAVLADLNQPDAAKNVVQEVMKKTGRIDALAHLVGGFAGGQSVSQAGDDVWEKMLGLNLTMSYRMFRAALAPMLDARQGRIIAVGSRAGKQAAADLAPYCTSKAALHMLVECTAEEIKHSGVAINAVLPSVIDTPANRVAMPSADPSKWVGPDAIAELIHWLAIEAPADLNGALIPVYGRS